LPSPPLSPLFPYTTLFRSGIGSYMSVALDQGNATAVLLAILAMVLMIVCVDQLLWRPLVVWVEKFRLDDTTGGGAAPGSWVLDLDRKSTRLNSSHVAISYA